ncbi:MAG: hypothetical protein J6A75_06250 [Lachnospiraceae bacterium]|nr:hypothetical protein [Lachnospiraceae bacterium]
MGEITELNTKKLYETNDFSELDLSGFIDKKQFSEYFKQLIEDKQKENPLLTKSYILGNCKIGSSYFYELLNTERISNKNPTKYLLVEICIVIGASIAETNTLLKYAGVGQLYARKEEDFIIMWGLAHHISYEDILEKLCDSGYSNLFGD